MEYKEFLHLDESKEKYLKMLNCLLEAQMEMCKELNLNDLESKMYSVGLYNGLELARAMYLGVEPKLFDGEKIRRKSDG